MEIQDQHVINSLGGLIAAILGWLGIRVHGKLDQLERESARKDYVEQMRAENNQTLERIFKRLDDIADRLPRKDDR